MVLYHYKSFCSATTLIVAIKELRVFLKILVIFFSLSLIQITVVFNKIPTNEQGARGWTREAPSVVRNENPSESSEAEESSDEETNEEDDWDSGECLLVRPRSDPGPSTSGI